MNLNLQRLKSIEKDVCKILRVQPIDLYSKERSRDMAEARMVVWFLAKEVFRFSYPYIGLMYSKDHTTILSGVEKIKNRKAQEHIYEVLEILLTKIVKEDGLRVRDEWRDFVEKPVENYV